MSKVILRITREAYANLPNEYNGFSKPEWGVPYIIEKRRRVYNLNTDYILNSLYSRLSVLSIQNTDSSRLPEYFQTLTSFINIARNEKIIIRGIEIDFFSDVWEFKTLAKRNQHKSSFVFRFTDFLVETNDYFDFVLRMFLLYMLTNSSPIHTSCHSHFGNVRTTLKRLYDLGIRKIGTITVNDLENVFNQPNWTYSTSIKFKVSFRYFLFAYSFLVDNVLSRDIDDYLGNRNLNLLNAEREQNKTPLLPEEFFEKLQNLLTSILDSDANNLSERLLAGLIIIGMQTGMRVSELENLAKTSLKVMKSGEKTVGIIRYYSSKTGRLKEIESETIATPKAIETFRKVVALNPSSNSTYLLVNNEDLPYKTSQLRIALTRICLRHCRELGIVNSPKSAYFKRTVSVSKLLKEFSNYIIDVKSLSPEDMISLPCFIQFRVYFASFWRARGVGDMEVSSMFGHLTYMMFGKYGREPQHIQDRKQLLELVEGIVNDEVTIIGPKGKAIQQKIERLIEENNIRVETNVSELCEKLLQKVEIRIKRGGFCIHSNLRRSCQVDSETDEFFCAYGVCPNQCHTYYSSPVTYCKFKDLMKVIEYNKTEGYFRQVEKEMSKLKSLLLLELIPELDDIRFQIEKKSKEYIISRHPGTAYIVENLDSIYSEIDEWLKKIESTLMSEEQNHETRRNHSS